MAHLFQINTSPGGLPKLPKTQAFISQLEVEGDAHNWKGHGGPNAAVCLYSLEAILTLQAEGHPVFPGALGENFTLSGVDWNLMQPGLQIQVGEEVLLEVVSFAAPCPKIDPYLKDMMRVSQEELPGWGRPYCKVLQTGTVTIGDTVTLL
jgi:MOSC domain-containing protein YiiM